MALVQNQERGSTKEPLCLLEVGEWLGITFEGDRHTYPDDILGSEAMFYNPWLR